MTHDVMDLSYEPDAQDRFVGKILIGLGVFKWLLLWQMFHEALRLELASAIFLAGATAVSVGLFAGLRGRRVRTIARGAFIIFAILFGLKTIHILFMLVISWF